MLLDEVLRQRLSADRRHFSAQVDQRGEVLGHLKEGDIFGEMSLLDNCPVSATIRTLRKSIVLKLPRKTFSEVLSTHPQLLAHISDLGVTAALVAPCSAT